MGDVDVYKQEEGDRPVERSPRERYIRFDIRLGSGAYKTVYKAYDTDQGIDVAWNAIDIGVLPASEKTRIIQEVQLLQKLEHKNIINFYGSWFSKEKNQVVFITEIMTSGNLKSYIKRVQFVKWKIIKRWCIQILEGLHYLHSQHPAVIHRDLKCDNIFINGNTGDLRIGDLGLSTQLAVHKRSKAQSVLGTPEFMAPELYDESYDEKVDIYAFGMCVLEMVTKEVPYSECINPAQIYKKVTAGIRPRGLQRIVSLPAREFIELCLSRGNGQIDVSAEYLLDHPFLKAQDDDNEMVQVLDEDALERDALSAVVLPPTPEMNSKQFADELNMESGSKGRDVAAAVVSERRKTLLLEPEALATGSSMVSPPLGSGMRSETAAEEKSAGKQRVLMPPSLATTGEKDMGVNAGGGAASDSSEPIVDEPLSDKKGEENHHVDNFLSGLPPTEANIRNDRIAVMGGRGHRIEIEDVQAYADDDVVPPTTLAAQQPPAVEAPVVTTATPTLGLNLPAAATLSQNSDRSTETTNSTVSVSVSDSTTVTIEARPRANTMSRPPSASKKPRKRYDIKATKDPDNDHSILLNLRMSLDGKSKEIKFPFNLFTDNSHEVACELAVDVGILEPDLEDIADSISFLVTEGKINNMSDVDLDVWDEAPEPHSFPTKPLPHVSKLTFESAAASHAHALLTSSLEAASPAVPIAQNAGNSSLPHEGMLATDTSFTVGSPTPYERNLSPPIGIPSMVHAASESIPSSLYHPDAPTGTTMLEHSMSVDAHYMQTVRQHEDRMKLARSSYDERESSLEEAMRTQEEKHQREIERIRMKMQEFNEKTARATMARQERMRLGTDEFRDDGSDLEDDNTARPSSTPPSMVVADEMQEPVVPAPTDGCGAVTETATESLSSTASSGRSPRNTENLPATVDHTVADLSLSPAPDLSVAPPTDAPPPAPSDNGSVADS